MAGKGAYVIDTDAIARDIVTPGSPVLERIRAGFGPSVVDASGELDRAALARIIFADPDKRARLNGLTHPEILKHVLALVGAQAPGTVVVVVVPLLFESGFQKNCDLVVAVVAPRELRRQRIAARDGLDEAQIEARMQAQLPEEDYQRHAHLIVRNDGDLAQLGREVGRVWLRISELTKRSPRRAAEKP